MDNFWHDKDFVKDFAFLSFFFLGDFQVFKHKCFWKITFSLSWGISNPIRTTFSRTPKRSRGSPWKVPSTSRSQFRKLTRGDRRTTANHSRSENGWREESAKKARKTNEWLFRGKKKLVFVRARMLWGCHLLNTCANVHIYIWRIDTERMVVASASRVIDLTWKRTVMSASAASWPATPRQRGRPRGRKHPARSINPSGRVEAAYGCPRTVRKPTRRTVICLADLAKKSKIAIH